MEDWKSLGNKEFQQGNFSKALEYYNKILSTEPNNTLVLNNRALVYLKIEKFELARLDTLNVLKLDHVNVKALYRLGLALENLGYLKEAKARLKEALNLEPNNSAIQTDLNRLESRTKVNLPQPPKSLFEFDKDWRNVKQDPQLSVIYLLSIQDLSQVFMSSITGDILMDFINTLNACLNNDNRKQVAVFTRDLLKLDRIDLVIAMLSDSDQTKLNDFLLNLQN